MNTRVKFLEAFSNACDISSLPFADCNYLFHEINLMSDEGLQIWIQSVDESFFQLEEWLVSLVYFQKWIQENKKTKNFPDQIEYLSCCIEGSANTGHFIPLIDLLKDNLDTFGIQ